MTLDIKQGDVLVYGKDYAIRRVNPWSDPDTPTYMMEYICKLTASTKRAVSPDGVTKKRGSPVAFLPSILISPIDPASFATQQSMIVPGTRAPTNLKECFVNDSGNFFHLILEDNIS